MTLDGSARTINRLNSTPTGSDWGSADRAYKVSFQHTYGKRHRHMIRLQADSLVANPLVSGQNINQSMSVYLTVDVPPGYDVASAKSKVDGLLANLSATTGANITKLLGGES